MPIGELLRKRLELGMKKYGHGVRVDMDTTTWGTPKDSWLQMAQEEFLDGVIYTIADYIKENNLTSDWAEEDDNELIMKVINEKKYMDSPKHATIIKKLIDIIVVAK